MKPAMNMMSTMQGTFEQEVPLYAAAGFEGIGLHSGKPARLTIRPASANHGVWFKRVDILLGDNMVPARWDAVELSPLCTRIKNRAGVEISTVEHVMAALAGCGVHNALIEIDGPEVPILDGSAAGFARAARSRAKGMAVSGVSPSVIQKIRPGCRPEASRRSSALARSTSQLTGSSEFTRWGSSVLERRSAGSMFRVRGAVSRRWAAVLRASPSRALAAFC